FDHAAGLVFDAGRGVAQRQDADRADAVLGVLLGADVAAVGDAGHAARRERDGLDAGGAVITRGVDAAGVVHRGQAVDGIGAGVDAGAQGGVVEVAADDHAGGGVDDTGVAAGLGV